MARLILSLVILCGNLQAVASAAELSGHWRFVAVRYAGTERPPPNPDLALIFEFEKDGSDRLLWSRKGIPGGCERRAWYQYANDLLAEVVTWSNPANIAECQADPDMQVGRQSMTPLRLVSGRLELDMSVADQKLTYLWQREDNP